MNNNFPFSQQDVQRAQRALWDSDASNYHQEHPEYVRDFYWGPEMLHEQDAKLLGTPESLAGQRIVEIGCGSAPCARWVAANSDAQVYGLDLSGNMLRHFEPYAGLPQPHLFQADALALPLPTASMDQAFSVFGAFAFIADVTAAFAEVARVLRPNGTFTFATNHPMRWIFPDDPGPKGLTARYSYFESKPYVELAEGETEAAFTRLEYVEFHRTISDWVAALSSNNFHITRVVEPTWPEDLDITWGQWSKLRGQIFPGTIIFQSQLLP